MTKTMYVQYDCARCKNRFSEVISPGTSLIAMKKKRRTIYGTFCPACMVDVEELLSKVPKGISKAAFQKILDSVYDFHVSKG